MHQVEGAGLSGLSALYELDKAGYDCLLLEASQRPGGRSLTVRSGDLIDEVGNRQVCEFDNEAHLYFNCGPARIPATHRTLMQYCRELGVELEVFINENKEAYVQDDAMFGGKPVKNSAFTTNARGFMAELMAKNFSREQLDLPFDEWEAERLIGAIRSFGDLDDFGGGMHFTKLGQAERIEAALRQGEQVHPDYRQHVEKGVTVAWHRMNHMLGCAARWARNGSMTNEEEHLMQTLRAPAAGRHYMIGDQVTLHAGWQESALLSAHAAIADIDSRVHGKGGAQVSQTI